jgi:hypothetical protein
MEQVLFVGFLRFTLFPVSVLSSPPSLLPFMFCIASVQSLQQVSCERHVEADCSSKCVFNEKLYRSSVQ